MVQATVGGGLAKLNFVGTNAGYTGYAQADFSALYNSTGIIGQITADFSGSGAVPNPTLSANATLALLPGVGNTLVPVGYQAIYDLAGGDTVTGSGNLTVFLQGGLAQGTAFNTGAASDKIFAGGNDTITAGVGSNTVVAGAGNVVVDGSSGTDLFFVGGAGAASVVGGSGNSTLFGGSGSALSFLRGGTGNSTLVGGIGTGTSMLVGGSANTLEIAGGSGPTTMIAGSGSSTIVGSTGSGAQLVSTNANGGTALIGLNDASDTVIGGTGASTVIAGSGTDLFGFIAGHAGGSETIYGLKQGDFLAFGGYSDNPIASEAVQNGSDVITLTDGTTITLAAIDHTLFK